MAEFIKRVQKFRATTFGTIIEGVVYAAMLFLVLVFLTGNGQFIYEGF